MNFRIEIDKHGRYVLIDDDTRQTTIYATQQEAEGAKAHLEAGGDHAAKNR